LNETEAFYDQNAQYEWDRLQRHRTEFAVTLRAFEDYLPTPPAKIADIGGGPGRYSIALAQRGHQVTLFDLSQGCLEFARQKAKEISVELSGYVHGNATNLKNLGDESFDAVLLMGPLYHLPTEKERRKALQETIRVLKRHGIIFATFITRYAPVRWVAKNEPASHDYVELAKQILSTGVQRPSRIQYGTRAEHFRRTSAYFAEPAEIKPLMESEGFRTLDVIACEGVISMIEEKVNELADEAFEVWVDLNYRLGRNPSLHGGAEHLLYVGRKPFER